MEKFETSKSSGEHKQLASLVGKWTGITKVWFEPDVLADESPASGTISLILDGRFVLHEYKGSMSGKALEGLAIFGYDLQNNKFQSAWIDSFHMGTGIMFSEGPHQEKSFAVTGSYGSREMSERWGWRTEIDLRSEDELYITMFNISPSGEEAKATETVYKRILEA
ncbi:DUF1579 domain-containing protein [Pedobacter sp. SYSU D00535]|uniref:DUF1579 domain-containing protein n=1 Tax=Pedobacter sp. SYSU D00535 TaxID=2810308 RepID=UPI001A979BB2|nr:DUF1579 domain-containing protein [Pedobacter sp. SYSU D00535]